MPMRLSRKAKSSLQRACVESLEKRTLLTAVVNGIFTGTNSIYDGLSHYEFKQADGASVRISIQGNVTAEFIGGRVPMGSGFLIIRDLVPAIVFDDMGMQILNPGDGVNIFSIYVLRSDINSTISIAEIANPAPDAEDRFMDPFGGGAGTIRFTNGRTSESETVTLDTGSVYIGQRTDFDAPSDNIPIITTDRRAFGLRPSSAGRMFSGIEVAPGNDLGRFMVGGTITGMVDIPGNVQMFYAGHILTGDATGIGQLQRPTIPRNFYIGADIENLITGNSFGTVTLDDASAPLDEIDYKTGFDLFVGGRLGQMRALDSFLGAATVSNHRSVRGSGLAQMEIEFRARPFEGGFSSFFDPIFNFHGIATLGDQEPNPAYFNDSFDTAQYLGALFSSELNGTEVIQVRGFTDGDGDVNDNVDYYAVSLIAGQQAEVQLLETSYRVAVFDPDGRLIATDYSNTASLNNRLNRAFRFNADRPGAYRIAIARPGDINFNGIADDGEDIVTVLGRFDYELRVTRVADIAFGGLIVDGHLATTDNFGDGINVLRGDLGAVRAGIVGGDTIFSFSNPWSIQSGNFRSIEAASIGILNAPARGYIVGSGVDFIVPRGIVGLIRATGSDPADDILAVNDNFSNSNGTTSFVTAADDLTQIDPRFAVGIDIQLVDAASNLTGNLLAGRAIGMIRAANVASDLGGPPVWAVNVDRTGNDGRIDLVDIQGDLGTLGFGGPAITTGPGGNARYIRVGGNVFRDRFFGGGLPQETIFQPGERAELTDDNGTSFVLTPVPLTNAIDPATGLPTGQLDNPGILGVITYPIRFSGGSVVVRATVRPSIVGANFGPGRGLRVTSGARGTAGSVEISEIVLRSAGTDYDFNEFTRTFTPEATVGFTQGQNADVILDGRSRIDVWSIQSRDPSTSATLTGITRILNGTGGEVVNVLAAHIGEIDAGNVGIARKSTGAEVQGVNVLTNTFPFNQQRNLVVANNGGTPGHIVSIRAREAVGNVLAFGSIGSVLANSDRSNVRGVFEGINAPIYAIQPGDGTNPDGGNIILVRIGEGVLPSGTGDVGFAGIYADGIIDRVQNQGLGSDIRGDIVARGQTTRITSTAGGIFQTTPTFIIGSIELTDGAIIDADIMTVTSLQDSREADNDIIVPQFTDPLTAPIFDIGGITIRGIGGIIGSNITAEDVGPIVIRNGFGFITSRISSLGDSVVDGIITDGYGVRSSSIDSGANVNRIIALGTGKRLDTREWTPSVRFSEGRSFDPYSGLALDASNDLHAYLGTTADRPKRTGFSDAGVIEDTQIVGSREVRLIEAHRIIGREVFTTNEAGQRRRIPFGSLSYPMRVSFGQGVGTIRTRDITDGLAVVAGGMDLFESGKNVQNTAFNITGRINRISTGANFRGSTSIKTQGSEGIVGTISTRLAFYAQLITSLDVENFNVGTDFGSSDVRIGRNLKRLNVTGSVLSGARITVNRTIENLIIGGDVQANAIIRADAINNQQIGGQILGDIIIE